jgi:TonB-dependent receptor
MQFRSADHDACAALSRFHLRPVSAACAALLFASGAAHSQQAPAPANAASAPAAGTNLGTVVIKGIRASLETSLALKRDSQGWVDGIVAEDIGKFPDTNLAESMQRISGVSIDRSLGEGSRITVRGVGPDFNMVLLNGRQMPASSIQDTTVSNSRAFDFANLASESIAALEVFKTSRASSPTGGIGATVNIRTARPLDTRETVANLGVKMVMDKSGQNLPDRLKGSTLTPEVSGIYSSVFADGKFGVSLSGSYQKRDLGYNQASVGNGWRSFKGDENNWGTIPQPGTPGSERIVNRPGPNDIYSVPQNLGYSFSGVQRERTNGQLTLQYAPSKDLKATLDYTLSQNKIHTRRNDLSAWFNFGPSSSTWTNGPVAAPLIYSETIAPPTSDIAMGGANFATKNENKSLGFNLAWKASDRLSFTFDAHSSTAESGADSPFGSNNVLGTASFNRGTTSVDFSNKFPVLSIEGSKIDAALQQVTGSSFRNSYMKSGVDQAQVSGIFKFEDSSRLDFGLAATQVDNRSAFSNVQRDTWGGASSPADYPDSVWQADSIAKYFRNIPGSGNPALFNQFFTFDFNTVRDLAAKAAGDESLYLAAPNFSTDRRTSERSQSAYIQYSNSWDWVVPINGAFGLRYEKTSVKSSALVPTATGITWVANNEFAVQYGAPGFTQLKGKYSYVLPSIDLDADLTSRLKLRLSYGETIGRPGWGDIQGGQTLNQLARIDGGTGSQGDPSLKPLKSRNTDAALEYYYAKGSYVAVGLFQKNIKNYVGTSIINATPFNLNTPAGGALFNEAVARGCGNSDLTCIRNYIFDNYAGQRGVTRGPDDANGNRTGTIAGQSGDPVASFRITVPANQRSDTLKGLELNLQHQFGNSGFGLGVNYTLVTSGLKYNDASLGEQFALEGVSDSANLVAFYEKNGFMVRGAYNWRGKFLAGRFDGAGPNPVYTAPYGQLDLSIGYEWSKNLSVQAEFINLNDGIQRLYSRNEKQTEFVTQTGRRFMIGARYKF